MEVKFIKCAESKLSSVPIIDGQVICLTDGPGILYDMSGVRKYASKAYSISDAYETSEGAASAGVAASSKAVSDAYNALSTSISSITPLRIKAPNSGILRDSLQSSYFNSTSMQYEFPVPFRGIYTTYAHGACIVNIARTYDNEGKGPVAHDTFLCYSCSFVYPASTQIFYSYAKLGYMNATGGGGTNPTSCRVELRSGTNSTTAHVVVPVTAKWSSINYVSVGIIWL